MAKTATYCSDCYNKVGRTEDAQIQAAEKSGQIPMTGQGTCCKCSKATVVVFYEN
ncbi:protein of unknown function [Nitrospira japonica]|uniref:Uncharacterized protein n=1 Tax=Nitrospira japonica TaxID=1325564 RepID=A0A1W1I049_9BACT|nr:hypothetical protein [Nitrospira japonica]SLM46371.1 protein of unknown function [Nitrospira japonica]